MKRYFHPKLKILIYLVVIIFGVSGFLWQRYPIGVEQYKTIKLGIRAAESAGTYTGFAPPYRTVPEALFYVYVIGDRPMCVGPSCGVGGYFVDCLGGWLSSYIKVTEEFDYGLQDAGVDTKKQPIVTVANKDAKIVGIYPGARVRNIPYIMMRNHKDLFSEDGFKYCSNLMPRRWK